MITLHEDWLIRVIIWLVIVYCTGILHKRKDGN